MGEHEVHSSMGFHGMACMYDDQGRQDDEKLLCQRAVGNFERRLGGGHALSLRPINLLGIVEFSLRNYRSSADLLERALRGRERTVGPEAQDTLKAACNLGYIYDLLRKLDDAEAMLLRSTKGMKKPSGPDNARAIVTVNDLAYLYQDVGRVDDAKKMYLEVLARVERWAVPFDVDTLEAACD